jgi:hypothetical protein
MSPKVSKECGDGEIFQGLLIEDSNVLRSVAGAYRLAEGNIITGDKVDDDENTVTSHEISTAAGRLWREAQNNRNGLADAVKYFIATVEEPALPLAVVVEQARELNNACITSAPSSSCENLLTLLQFHEIRLVAFLANTRLLAGLSGA